MPPRDVALATEDTQNPVNDAEQATAYSGWAALLSTDAGAGATRFVSHSQRLSLYLFALGFASLWPQRRHLKAELALGRNLASGTITRKARGEASSSSTVRQFLLSRGLLDIRNLLLSRDEKTHTTISRTAGLKHQTRVQSQNPTGKHKVSKNYWILS